MSDLEKLQKARAKANKSKKAAAQRRIDEYFFGIPCKAAVSRRRQRKAKKLAR